MKRVKGFLFLLIIFFVSMTYLPLYAREGILSINRLRDKVEQSRLSGTLTKRTNIQELLEQASVSSASRGDSLFKQIDTLTLACQDSLAKNLLAEQQQSLEQAFQLLKNTAIGMFAKEKYPLITFMYTLKKRWIRLNKLQRSSFR